MSWEHFVIIASLWLASGMTAASILYRRGHDGWHWLLLCGIAGPLAALIVVDQARIVEPRATPITIGRATGHTPGVTVVVPAVAVRDLDDAAVRATAGSSASVVIAFPVAYEHLATGLSDIQLAAANALDDARKRFANHRVEVVVTPGAPARAVVGLAAERAPAVVLTSQAVHPSSTLARVARLVARHPGVELTVHAQPPVPTASSGV